MLGWERPIIHAIGGKNQVGTNNGGYTYSTEQYFAGAGIFWSGLSVGIANLACGICVGITGAKDINIRHAVSFACIHVINSIGAWEVSVRV